MSGTLFVLRKLWADRLARIGLIIISALIICAIFAPWLATFPEHVYAFEPSERLKPPDATYVMGTDRMGADIFSRVLFGTRITITIAVIAVGASILIGVPLGLAAGYWDGWWSDLIMRGSDVFLAIPQVILAIAIAQTLGPSLPNVILALSVTFWPWFTRLAFAETRAPAQGNLHRSDHRDWRHTLARDHAPRAAERRVANHHPHLARHGFYHPDRRGAGLPRPRRAAADARVGPDDRRIARVPAECLVVRPGAGTCDFPRGHGLQHAG